MNVFENLKSMDIDEFAKWFEENCIHDGDPCIRWWSETYCKDCKPIIKSGMEHAYCELSNKCRYFKDMETMPSTRKTIKLWLESECN